MTKEYLEQLIERELLKEQAYRKDRKGSGKWKPSLFGRCYRYQYWARQSLPLSDPYPLHTLKSFAQGSQHHKFIQSFLPLKATEVKIETEDVLGFADWVDGDVVYDFKGADSWKHKKYWNIPTEAVLKGNLGYCLQLCFYADVLRKNHCCLVGMVYGTFKYVMHWFHVADYKHSLDEELSCLRGAWTTSFLPDPIPRSFGGSECNYCCYRSKCKEYEEENKK